MTYSIQIGCGNRENVCVRETNNVCSQQCTMTYNSYYCSCDEGYRVHDNKLRDCPALCEHSRLDLTFLIDASSEVDSYWSEIIEFAVNITTRFTFDSRDFGDFAQLSVILFDDRATKTISWGQFSRKEILIQELNSMRLLGGRGPNCANAFDDLLQDYLARVSYSEICSRQ